MTHKLKTLPAYWDAVQRGEKTFEVRRDDRGFQRGDKVELIRHDGLHKVPMLNDNKWNPETYIITAEIRYVLTGGQFGIEPGYVVLGLGDIE